MASYRLLIVDEDTKAVDALRIFLTEQGHQVDIVSEGDEALAYCRRQLPDLILMETALPDGDGYAVCRELRTTTQTSLVPIIFVTEQRSLQDKVAGLEAGADDFVTKPFDIEELYLRIQAAIRAHQHFSMTDAQTNLPSGRLIEDQIRDLVRATDWTLLYIGVEHVSPFNTEYGFMVGDQVLRFAGNVIQDIVTQFGTLNDFVGRASNEVFLVITRSDQVESMADQLRKGFGEGVRTYYSPTHRERGGIEQSDGSLAPLMSLSIGIVSDKDGPFYDINEITQAAAQARRVDQQRQRA
jgi:PleD family two-component response regulator